MLSYTRMSMLLSRMVAFAIAVVLLGTAATASARPKKHSPATKPAVRSRITARGSGGLYAPARLSPPSLALPQQSTGVYIPPPLNNPSAQINQLNQSFPLNRGLGRA